MEMTKEKRDTIIDTLYERCSNGEISISQREALIQKTNSLFITTESSNLSTESEEDTLIETKTYISPKEKYHMFKESVYKKYSSGEITLEAREELLEKARDKFFYESN
jgi:hypothetical protein